MGEREYDSIAWKVVETRFPRNGTHEPGQQLVFVHSGNYVCVYFALLLMLVSNSQTPSNANATLVKPDRVSREANVFRSIIP